MEGEQDARLSVNFQEFSTGYHYLVIAGFLLPGGLKII